jgi:hypothetical protein
MYEERFHAPFWRKHWVDVGRAAAARCDQQRETGATVSAGRRVKQW